MDDLIKVYDNVFSLELCQHYINLIEKAPKKAGRIFNNDNLITNPSVKLSEDVCFSILYPSEINFILKTISKQIEIYEKEIGMEIPIKSCEYFNGRVYRKHKGQFKSHIDVQSKETLSRCLSVIIYLNTVEKGGELKFIYQNKIINIIRGRVVFFPSYWMYKHEALIPISNDRYILRTFLKLNE